MPARVSLLAIWNYLGAVVSLAFALVTLAGTHAMTIAFAVLGHPDEDFSEYTLAMRFVMFAIFIGVAALCFVTARAFWMTKNWARQVTMVLSVFDLILGGPPSGIWSRIFSVIVVWFLLTPGVKAAFGISLAGDWPQIELAK